MIYKFLFIVGFAIVFYMFPKVRCFIFNLWRVVYYLPIDLFLWFKHKEYNRVPTGELIAVIGLFGKGKTLTAVHIIAKYYLRKNGKMVWCPRRKKMVKQRVKIISNVDLLVPYEKFIDMQQFFRIADLNRKYDDLEDTLTVTLFLGDEFSVQLNNRQFKTNIDAQSLNTLLTSRHHYIALYYTTQRFQLVDALLRQVTQKVIDCQKTWRLQGINYYDAWQLENASSPLLVKPYLKRAWFVTNKDYNMYNTLAVVESLRKAIDNGDMLSDAEILALQNNNPDVNQILKPSRRLIKLRKKVS
jgi:hypothetical protein